jgi:two-component sensor histidine kinase
MPSARSDARWSDALPLTIALWLFVLLIFLPVIVERHAGEGWTSVALDGATVFVSMAFAMPLFALFRATVDWRPIRRLPVLALAIVVTAICQTIFDFLFSSWVAANLASAWANLPRNVTRISGALLNYLFVFGVNMGLFQLSFSRRRALSQERQLAAARAATQQAQLEALRLQLNPHFLFNTLNAISAMIVTQRNADAEQMTDKLSAFLRSSLAFDPTALVPLDEELELTQDYLEIEGVRFRDRLRADIRCAPAACKLLVPGLLIQPLVENAIKYGVARSSEPVTIAIMAERVGDTLCITVANTGGAGDRVPMKAGGAGVGLANVRRRLAALYGAAGTLSAGPEEGGFAARICLPAAHTPEG